MTNDDIALINASRNERALLALEGSKGSFADMCQGQHANAIEEEHPEQGRRCRILLLRRKEKD